MGTDVHKVRARTRCIELHHVSVLCWSSQKSANHYTCKRYTANQQNIPTSVGSAIQQRPTVSLQRKFSGTSHIANDIRNNEMGHLETEVGTHAQKLHSLAASSLAANNTSLNIYTEDKTAHLRTPSQQKNIQVHRRTLTRPFKLVVTCRVLCTAWQNQHRRLNVHSL